MLITAAGSPAQLIPRQTNTDTALPEPESGNPAEGDDDDVEDAPVDTAAPPPDAEETDVAIGDESGPSDVTSPTRRQEEEGTTTPPATGTPTATQQQATTGLGTTGRDDDDTTAPTDPTTNPNDDNTTAGPTQSSDPPPPDTTTEDDTTEPPPSTTRETSRPPSTTPTPTTEEEETTTPSPTTSPSSTTTTTTDSEETSSPSTSEPTSATPTETTDTSTPTGSSTESDSSASIPSGTVSASVSQSAGGRASSPAETSSLTLDDAANALLVPTTTNGITTSVTSGYELSAVMTTTVDGTPTTIYTQVPTDLADGEQASTSSTRTIIIGTSVAGAVLVLVLLFGGLFWYSRKKRQRNWFLDSFRNRKDRGRLLDGEGMDDNDDEMMATRYRDTPDSGHIPVSVAGLGLGAGAALGTGIGAGSTSNISTTGSAHLFRPRGSETGSIFLEEGVWPPPSERSRLVDPFLKGLGERDNDSLHDSVVDQVMGPSQQATAAGATKHHHARDNSTTSMYTPLLVDEDPFAAARPRPTSPSLRGNSPSPTPPSYGLPPGAASPASVLPSSRGLVENSPGFLAAPTSGHRPVSPNSPSIQPGYHASLASRSSSTDATSPSPPISTPVKPSPLAQIAAKAPSSTGHSSSSHIGPSSSRTATPTRAYAAGTSSPPPKITWLEGPSEASLGSLQMLPMPGSPTRSRASSPSGGLGLGMSTSSVNLGDPRMMRVGRWCLHRGRRIARIGCRDR